MSTASWISTIRAHALRSPGTTAVTESGGSSVTREELVERIDSAVRALRDRGMRAGDPVLFSVRPGVSAIVLVLAVHELGGVLLPMDPGVSDTLFDARMATLRPRWVFAESLLLAAPSGFVARLLRSRGMHFAPLGRVQGARFVRVGPQLPGAPPSVSYRRLLREGKRAQRLERSDAATAIPGSSAASHRIREGAVTSELTDDAASFIVCTSGTTASPKAVIHTRRSLDAIIAAVQGELALTSTDTMCARDLHLILPALLAGARAVIPGDREFSGARALALFHREHVTHAFLVTRDCRLLLDACLASGKRVPDTVRSLMIGAAPVRAAFLSRLAEVLPPHTVAWCVYGATEVLPVARVSLREKVEYDGPGDLVGTPIPGVNVRVDGDGHLCISGDRMFAGYVGEPPVLEHRSGDLASISGGRVVLLGRTSDMIIRGEHNIYPALYEPLVEQTPGVRRAALVGDFDAALADERLILVVEPEAGADPAALIARVQESVRSGPLRLDSSAQPDRIVIASLPESGRSHKIDKSALRRKLGLTAAGELATGFAVP
ncbi:MAG TPA: class I adenylate-forming enzyme family protein [Gemmatimonas sp.]|nr:class I adenylate-forming enzyme family protein [Gemmatimonas sp.]